MNILIISFPFYYKLVKSGVIYLFNNINDKKAVLLQKNLKKLQNETILRISLSMLGLSYSKFF